MKVIRHIHPIGQGAFYTERFVNDDNTTLANVVYDCGCNKKLSQSSKKMIEFTYSKNDEIDILFISHFDADHVNGIKTLMDNRVNIRYIIMPLLTPDEIKFLSAFYYKTNKSDTDIQTLINNPKAYFDRNTTILKVAPIDENYGDENIQISLDNFDVSKISIKENYYCINSFCKITLRDIWIYIPANFKSNERSKKFFELLNDKNIDFKNNVDCLKKYKTNELRKIYDLLDGNVNGNSLLLYSGSISNKERIKTSYCLNSFFAMNYTKVHTIGKSGCLYLGDSNLNDKNELKKDLVDYLYYYLNHYKAKIGLIQIPHHGSLISFSKKILSFCDCKYYFLTCGDSNDYGHPSEKIIEELNIKNLYIQNITEHKDSRLIQIIEL